MKNPLNVYVFIVIKNNREDDAAWLTAESSSDFMAQKVLDNYQWAVLLML